MGVTEGGVIAFYVTFAVVFVIVAVFRILQEKKFDSEPHDELLQRTPDDRSHRPAPISSSLQSSFVSLASEVEKNPRVCFFVPLILCSVLMSGLTLYRFEDQPSDLWVTQQSETADESNRFLEMFGEKWRAESVIFSLKDRAYVPFFESLEVIKELYRIESDIRNLTAFDRKSQETVSFSDVCYQEYKTISTCAVFSVTEYFTNPSQTNIPELTSYEEMMSILEACSRAPTTPSCVSNGGISVNPDSVFATPGQAYLNATAVVLSLFVKGGTGNKAFVWEEAFIDYMLNYSAASDAMFDVLFSAERSVIDEVTHVGSASTWVIISEVVLVCALLSLYFSSVLLAIVTVAIAVLSTFAAISIISIFGMYSNAFLEQALPLMLTMFVFDVPILMFSLSRIEPRLSQPHNPTQISLVKAYRILAKPFLASVLSQVLLIGLGVITFFPALESYSIALVIAIIVSNALNFTIFGAAVVFLKSQTWAWVDRCKAVPLFASMTRCVHRGAGMGINVLFMPLPRVLSVLALVAFGCAFVSTFSFEFSSGLSIPDVIPESSYLFDFYQTGNPQLRFGPFVFFVASGLDLSDVDQQNLLCKNAEGCLKSSLANYLDVMADQPRTWYLAKTPTNWLDDYLTFLSPLSGCCYVYNRTADVPVKCPPDQDSCVSCADPQTFNASQRFQGQDFYRFLALFLDESHCDRNCTVCGSAYRADVVTERNSDGVVTNVKHSRFQTNQVPLITASDYIEAIDSSMVLASHIENSFGNFFRFRSDGGNAECFAFSEFFAFNEQYLHMMSSTKKATLIASVITVIIGMSVIRNVGLVLISLTTAYLIMFDTYAYVVASDIPSNPITLTNLLAALSISLTSCYYVSVHFATSGMSRKASAILTVKRLGSPMMFSLLIKFIGITVMVLPDRQMFADYFASFFWCNISFVFLHALILLPLLLSFFGPTRLVADTDEL